MVQVFALSKKERIAKQFSRGGLTSDEIVIVRRIAASGQTSAVAAAAIGMVPATLRYHTRKLGIAFRGPAKAHYGKPTTLGERSR